MVIDLLKLDSLTKYPSIPTYHEMLDQKKLKNPGIVQVVFQPNEMLHITEKIDGMNVRLILTSDGMAYLGSRDKIVFGPIPLAQLLDQFDTTVINDVFIDKFRDLLISSGCQRFLKSPADNQIMVVYFELYGGKSHKSAKHYTNNRDKYAICCIDCCSIYDWEDKMQKERNWISGWREHGGQKYMGQIELREYVSNHLGLIDYAPIIHDGFSDNYDKIKDIVNAYYWLHDICPRRSRATLDSLASGVVEGVVIRNTDRSRIAKLRFEDYERTLDLR